MYTCGKGWPMRRPVAETYKDLQVAPKNPLERWLGDVAECLRNDALFDHIFHEGQGVSARGPRKVYACWPQDNGYDWNVTEASFSTKLSALANGCRAQPPPWVRKVKSSRMLYYFDRAMMIKRRYGTDA